MISSDLKIFIILDLIYNWLYINYEIAIKLYLYKKDMN